MPSFDDIDDLDLAFSSLTFSRSSRTSTQRSSNERDVGRTQPVTPSRGASSNRELPDRGSSRLTQSSSAVVNLSIDLEVGVSSTASPSTPLRRTSNSAVFASVTSTSSGRSVPTTPASQTYSRASTLSPSSSPRRSFAAYVLFRGATPGVYTRWSDVEEQFTEVPKYDSLFKGFYTLEDAENAFSEMEETGVIDTLADSLNEDYNPVWVVTYGVKPGVYIKAFGALASGLGYAGGALHFFPTEREAWSFHRQQTAAGRVKKMNPLFPAGRYT